MILKNICFNRLFSIPLFLLSALFFGTISLSAVEPYIYGITDKDPLSYQLGEEMIFSLSVREVQSPSEIKLKWKIQGDDGQVSEGMEQYQAVPLKIKTSISQPGFVHLTVQALDSQGKVLPIRPFQGSAGAEWQSLKNISEPNDFDAFWKEQRKRLDAVPMKATLTPVNVPEDKDNLYYDVKIDCLGKPVSGYYRKPKNAKPKSLPIRIAFIGYNYHSAFLPTWANDYLAVDPHLPLSWAPNSDRLKNALIFNINAHGYENGRSQEYYDHFAQTEGKNYGFIKEENRDREKIYFTGMIRRAIRLLQWLKTEPEWDGKTIVVAGGSQGGFQALALAGLDSDVSECYAFIPWLCNIGGHDLQKRLPSSFIPEYTDALRYIDAANHAKRIRGNVLIVAGLGDFVCPPAGLAVLYNCIASSKTIEFRQGMKHPEEMPNAPIYHYTPLKK